MKITQRGFSWILHPESCIAPEGRYAITHNVNIIVILMKYYFTTKEVPQ